MKLLAVDRISEEELVELQILEVESVAVNQDAVVVSAIHCVVEASACLMASQECLTAQISRWMCL